MHSIERLTIFDDTIIEAICDSLKKAYNPSISKYFIYQDPNFKTYFRTKIQTPNNYIFYSRSKDSRHKKLTGFVFFEVIKNTIFLRNILIDHKFIGQGLGGNLFSSSLKAIIKEHPELEILQLDTFEKNTAAVKWYIGIGMVVDYYLNWYDITYLFKNTKPARLNTNWDETITLNQDEFGFAQLLHQKDEIGTLVNKKHLIIKAEPTLELINQIQYYFLQNPPNSVCIISKRKLILNLLDRSVHLAINLKNLNIN